MTSPPHSPLSSDRLLKNLADAGIQVTTTRHKPLLTVEDSKEVRTSSMDGGHCKNLFLRNKKGRMWLVTCHEDRTVDLKALGAQLRTSAQTTANAGANRLSFASAQRLFTHLGVIPGAVSPFGLANDHAGNVTFYLDKALLAYDKLYFHPLDNSMTTQIQTPDLIRYLESINHPVNIVDFDSSA